MSTVQEIESAIERLPREQFYELQRWFEEKLGPAHPPEGYFAEAYKNWPEERINLEEAMLKNPQHPDR